ncbi:hypothetical protein HOLleu_16746 [Holothuria leucospilota]|uniref:Uncharacterized protein n=1 Tax=Holothuria leucospilota TaxID=206669 RepID=A0A9Q1C6U3_HOLLE|nr:hypothetical protein HOLleu_16746 [Holothuria leucospilota]
MSQSSLINDVKNWSADRCKNEVAEILPKLVSLFTNGCTLEKKVSLLGVMTNSFFPVLSLDQIETNFLSVVLPEAQKVHSATLDAVLAVLEDGDTSENIDTHNTLNRHLEMTLNILAPLESILHHVVDKSEGSIDLDTVPSVPLIIVHIIRKSFDHCKDSNIIYGSFFEAMSEQLSQFFKKTYTLQKSLMTLLDLTQPFQQDSDMATIATKVSTEFHELCSVIGTMDTSLMASTWKFLIKFVTKHKEGLSDSLQMSDMIDTLCDEIRSHFKHSLTQAPLELNTDTPPSQGRDQKAFSRTVKICGLLAKMLLHLLKEFEYILEECSKMLLSLVIYLHSYCPPSLQCPTMRSDVEDEMKRTFLVCIEPLLQQLVQCRSFCEALLSPNQSFEDTNSFGYLKTLVNVMRIVPECSLEVQSNYHALQVFPEDPPRHHIIKCLLSTVSKCYTEFTLPVCLPGVMHDGQPQQSISLHEYVVTYVNAFVATVTGEQYSKIEQCLLEAVMSDDVSSALVAMDVWCFVARYGTAELCAHHCRFLADLIKSMSGNESPSYVHLCILLQRLIPLMAETSQHEFVSQYPVADNLGLWSILPLPAFSSEVRQSVCQALSGHCLNLMQTWIKSNSKESLLKLPQCIDQMCKLFHQFEPGEPPVESQMSAELAESLLTILERVPVNKEEFIPLLCPTFELCGHLLLHLKSERLLSMFKTTSSTVSCVLKFSSLCLLCKLKKLNLTNHPHRDEILQLIPNFFSSFLSDANPIIHQLAMEDFSGFAEETAHESLVPECLQDEETQNRVVQFLNQVPTPLTTETSEEEWLNQQAEILHRSQDCEEVNSNPFPSIDAPLPQERGAKSSASNSDESSEEPKLKKPKLDCEKSIQMQLSEIQASFHKVSSLLSDLGYRPSWLTSELDHLSMLLTAIKGS